VLLCLDLSKRDLNILLLVVRLTYGCPGHRWARLKQVDLATVGIGPTHASDCLQSLLARNLLVQHGTLPEYRLHLPNLATHVDAVTRSRQNRLILLISRQLGMPYYEGNFTEAFLPKRGRPMLPNSEVAPYLKGNIPRASGWSLSRSTKQFEKDFTAS